VTFCGLRSLNPACGAIAEINPATWAVISQRWYDGVVWNGRYSIVATRAGAWVSAGGGGNGAWMDFFSLVHLRQAHEAAALGWLSVSATGDTVWASPSGRGLVTCYSASASGSVRETTAVGQPNKLLEGPGSPFGIESHNDSLLVATLNAGDLVAVKIPRACKAGAG
jgi:hypothetical protein